MHFQAILAHFILLLGCNSFTTVASPAIGTNNEDIFSKLKSCMVTDVLECNPGIEKCVQCDVDSTGQITKYCVKLDIPEGTLCNIKERPGCKCGPGIYQQYDKPWISPIRVLMDPTLNPSCYTDADCQSRNLGQSCALCEFSIGTRMICSDDRRGKEDRFWCKDPRCKCEEKAGTVKQEHGQLAAARLELPLTSNEKVGQTLARLQSPSYYIPGDVSTEVTGSEPDKPFDQRIRGHTFNDMNFESYTNTQASDEGPFDLQLEMPYPYA